VMMVIDEHRIRWCNAGHTPPVLIGRGGRRELTGTGLPLGVDPEGAYSGGQAPFQTGDLVLAFTDGLTEARRDGRQFGDERLGDLLGLGLPPDAYVQRLREEAEAWAPKLDDDMVILALRRRP
jgi:serine phosphatase RsbU (regulator of sigma subunit)